MAFEPIIDRALTDAFLGEELRGELLSQAGGGAPNEACGLLFADATDAGLGYGARVTSVISVPNVAPDSDLRRRFELDSVGWVTGEAAARERGEVLIGLWHSHPDGPPRPSREDAIGAASLPTGLPYVLVDLSALGSAAAVTFWRWGPATRASGPRAGRRGL
jgi:proteasome lid subunit RPN8/RPN11